MVFHSRPVHSLMYVHFPAKTAVISEFESQSRLESVKHLCLGLSGCSCWCNALAMCYFMSGTGLLGQLHVLHTETEVADQTISPCRSILTLGQPVLALTLLLPGAWQGSHLSDRILSHWDDPTRKKVRWDKQESSTYIRLPLFRRALYS